MRQIEELGIFRFSKLFRSFQRPLPRVLVVGVLSRAVAMARVVGAVHFSIVESINSLWVAHKTSPSIFPVGCAQFTEGTVRPQRMFFSRDTSPRDFGQSCVPAVDIQIINESLIDLFCLVSASWRRRSVSNCSFGPVPYWRDHK